MATKNALRAPACTIRNPKDGLRRIAKAFGMTTKVLRAAVPKLRTKAGLRAAMRKLKMMKRAGRSS